MAITRQDVNEDITSKITGKNTPKSITQTEDGANRVLMMDYLDQEVKSIKDKISVQITANDSNPPEIKQADFIRCFTTGVNSDIKLTGPHTIGREYYIKNTTSFPITLIGNVENINGNSTLDINPGTYWHLIKEDSSTNSITAFKLSLI